MKITVTFDSLEEFIKCMKPGEGFITSAETEVSPMAEPEKPKRGRPKKDAEEQKPEEPAVPAEEKPALTLTDVRAVALKLSKSGKQAELKAAFEKFGGKKLSDIKEADYPALMEELSQING